MLSVGLGSLAVGYQSSQAQVAAARRAAAQTAALERAVELARCEAGNDYRAGDRQLWEEEIFALQPAPGETPAQQAARQRNIAALKAYLAVHDAPVDCSRVVPAIPGVLNLVPVPSTPPGTAGAYRPGRRQPAGAAASSTTTMARNPAPANTTTTTGPRQPCATVPIAGICTPTTNQPTKGHP